MALDKPAEQLGKAGELNTAARAVDGNVNPVMDDGSCAQPYSGVSNDPPVPVWWYVDLGQSYRTTQIVLYNRASVQGASKHITIFM